MHIWLKRLALAGALLAWSVGFISTAAAQVPQIAADAPADENSPPLKAPAEAASPAAESGSSAGDTSIVNTAQPLPADFQRKFTEWRQLLVRLRELQVEYLTASEFKRQDLRLQFEVTLGDAAQIFAELQKDAESVFLANSKQSGQAAAFLFMSAVDGFRTDDLERADRILKLLVKDGAFDNRVYDLAAMVTFEVGDIDSAEKFAGNAQDAKVISPQAKELIPKFPVYRLLWARERELRAKEKQADDLPRVLLRTTKGDIVLEMFENEAPNTVANFISLVEKGFYNGLSFHRVIDGFMAQGGCPRGDGTGGPGYRIPCECERADARQHFRGSVSMAHAGKDTGGSQFFIMFRSNQNLDGKHTVFGRVVAGMDIVSRLQRRDPVGANPPDPDRILDARVLSKRPHDYKPVTLPDR
jgi:cyclophilin family peptidyl-prolyl cis-trans isomerase